MPSLIWPVLSNDRACRLGMLADLKKYKLDSHPAVKPMLQKPPWLSVSSCWPPKYVSEWYDLSLGELQHLLETQQAGQTFKPQGGRMRPHSQASGTSCYCSGECTQLHCSRPSAGASSFTRPVQVDNCGARLRSLACLVSNRRLNSRPPAGISKSGSHVGQRHGEPSALPQAQLRGTTVSL